MEWRLDLKSPQAKEILERLVKWADVLVINFPPPVRKRLKLTYEDIAPWNPRLIYADISGYGDDGPDANLPGFDITAYWARSGLLALTRDAGAPPTLPPSGSGDHATAVGLYAAIVTALYRRERTGKGSHVTTSLVAEGAWSCSMYIQAALCGAKFYPLHDRMNPPNPIINVYRTSDDHWFLIVLQAKDWPALAQAIGRPDLLSDVRFADEKARAANASQLTEILDQVFASKPGAQWRPVLDQAHITYGAVRHPSEAITDPQLLANDIIVPLEGAGENLKYTVSSPLKVHGVAKVPARRAPDVGEHNDEVLEELGFTSKEIEELRTSGTIPPLGTRINRGGLKIEEQMDQPRIVIVGGGFGGLAAAKALRNTPARVILIDRTNHHLFQPLLYQVATAALTPGQIGTPIRGILRNQKNAFSIHG